jgi:hypothetical protein
MSLVTHLESLEMKHTQLEEEIAAQAGRPLPDFMMITMLKKQKLHIKEELERLSYLSEVNRRKAGT